MRKLARALAVSVLAVSMAACQAAPSSGEAPVDSTTNLQSMFDALQPGDTLTLEPRIYQHSGVLTVDVPNVRIIGNGATLHATKDDTSAVQIVADGVSLSDIRLTAPLQGKRYMAPAQHKLVLAADNLDVSGINIEGSAGAGIFVDGAKNFEIRDVEIDDTRADGLHMTNGAANGVVDDVRTARTGDDGVAVVSYGADPTGCRNITVTNVRVDGTRWGRGMTVVGGTNITMRGFSIADTDSAGLYVATEGDPYYTRTVENVTIADGTVSGANRNADIVQGAVLVAVENPGTAVRNVAISDVSIAATPPSAERNVAIYTRTGALSGIRLDRISLDTSTLPAFFSNADARSFALTGWTAGGDPIAVN